jgi:hypothetical protein
MFQNNENCNGMKPKNPRYFRAWHDRWVRPQRARHMPLPVGGWLQLPRERDLDASTQPEWAAGRAGLVQGCCRGWVSGPSQQPAGRPYPRSRDRRPSRWRCSLSRRGWSVARSGRPEQWRRCGRGGPPPISSASRPPAPPLQGPSASASAAAPRPPPPRTRRRRNLRTADAVAHPHPPPPPTGTPSAPSASKKSVLSATLFGAGFCFSPNFRSVLLLTGLRIVGFLGARLRSSERRGMSRTRTSGTGLTPPRSFRNGTLIL